MSLVVAVASHRGAAVATDSVMVDFTSGMVRTGYVKHVACGNRVAGIAGISEVGGVDFLQFLQAACRNAKCLDNIGDEFLRAGSQRLVDSFIVWRDLMPTGTPVEEFVTLVVASTETSNPEVGRFSTTVKNDMLTMEGETQRPIGRAGVFAAGAADDIVIAHTEAGRIARMWDGLHRKVSRYAKTEPLSTDLSGQQCATWAENLVKSAIDRESALPRPSYWPQEVPLLAHPVHVAICS